MSEGKKINEAATVSGLPSGGFVLVTDSGGGLKRLSVDALLADVRGSVKVGGRNLLLDSGTEITGGAYQFARYKFSTDNMLKAGEPFALTIWGTMAFQAFVDGGTKMVGRTSGSDGVYKLSGTWKYDGAELWIYKRENADLSTQTITRIKLERGNVATDWTPAPEDYMPTNSTSGGGKEQTSIRFGCATERRCAA